MLYGPSKPEAILTVVSGEAENSPKNIVRIFDYVSELRNQNKEDISIDVLQNMQRLFPKIL